MPKERRRPMAYEPTANETDAFEQAVARLAGTVRGMQSSSLHRISITTLAMADAVEKELYRRVRQAEHHVKVPHQRKDN